MNHAAAKNQEKVKLYGLLEMNQKTYIKIQILGFACLAIAFVFSLLYEYRKNSAMIFFSETF